MNVYYVQNTFFCLINYKNLTTKYSLDFATSNFDLKGKYTSIILISKDNRFTKYIKDK